MSAPVDCDKLCVYSALLIKCTEKAMQRHTLRSTIDKSKWNSKKCSRNTLEVWGKNKNRGKKETNRTQLWQPSC